MQNPNKCVLILSVQMQIVQNKQPTGFISCLLTFSLHAHGQALLIAAVLASVPLSLIHNAVFIVPTGVAQVFPNCSLEEAFAALTAVYAIMFT